MDVLVAVGVLVGVLVGLGVKVRVLGGSVLLGVNCVAVGRFV